MFLSSADLAYCQWCYNTAKGQVRGRIVPVKYLALLVKIKEKTVADRPFKVALVQHEWVTTEIFDISAKDEKAAEAEAKKIIETKELKVPYRLEVKQAEVEAAPVASPPPEPELR